MNYDPLERMPTETRRANQALHDYALMGPGRSLRKLIAVYHERIKGEKGASIPTKQLNRLFEWSATHEWQSRIDEFDRQVAEAELGKWLEEREERRRKLYEQDWTDGETLRQKVAAFIEELPRFIRTTEREIEREGERVRVVTIKLNATIDQIARALKTGSDLQRMAINEPTDHYYVSGASIDAKIASELARLADASQAPASGSFARNINAEAV